MANMQRPRLFFVELFLTNRHSVAQVLHLLKSEEAFHLKMQFQALIFETLYHKTQVLKVFLHGLTLDINVVEVDCNELVYEVAQGEIHSTEM
jgi:hypothetical protein